MSAKQVQVSFGQLAQFALGVMSKAVVQADDEQIAYTQAARQFLHAVVAGELIISQAPAKGAEAPQTPYMTKRRRPASHSDGVVPAGQAQPGAAPVRGSEGVVSEGITGAPKI